MRSFRLNIILLLISFILFYPNMSQAQFQGGNDDGYAIASYTQDDLTTVNNIYAGGDNDGYNAEIFVQADLTPVNNIYAGGNNDGCYAAVFVQADLAPVNNIYAGGDNDGYNAVVFVQADLTPVNNIYAGGDNDGYNAAVFVQADLTPVNNIYAGGDNDGYYAAVFVQADLTPVNNIYAGGDNDGYNAAVFAQGDLVPINNIFSGGADDGFAIAYVSGPGIVIYLPIELLTFTAEPLDKDVMLKWQTVTETNNDYFTIERSQHGQAWENVGIVPGAGNSNSILNYQLLDYSPFSGLSYYRLKQTDFDGKFSYSQIRAVRFNGNVALVIYPNPTLGSIFLQSSVEELETIQVFNSIGQEVTNQVQVQEIGVGQKELNLSTLSSGLYVIKTRTMVNTIIKR